MRVIELTIDARKIQVFSFLKNSPTRVLEKDNYYKFIYFEPIETALTVYRYPSFIVNVKEKYLVKKDLASGWSVVRKHPISLASKELIDILQELEVTQLEKERNGRGIELSGWLFDTIITGIFTRQETSIFIKLLFLNGYTYQETLQLFAVIVKRTSLISYFLETMNRIYKGVEFG